MPFDLALSTNTPTATLELRQVQPLGGTGQYAAFLVVRSGAFAAALPFVFLSASLLAFGDALAAMHASRTGSARLAASTSDDAIWFESADGEVRMCGDLREQEGAQRLQFSFVAEWASLPGFISGIRHATTGGGF